jgi:CBS domain containing-hemolysin-like protein
MGGYLCELAGRVPEEGERFYLGGYRFHVQDADPRQVRWILIEQPSSGGDAAGEAERPLEPRS